MKHKDKRLRTKKGIYNYSWENLKRSIAKYLDYPQYYQEVCTVCLNYDESEATVDFQHVGLALETVLESTTSKSYFVIFFFFFGRELWRGLLIQISRNRPY
jgi:hypothetical protein